MDPVASPADLPTRLAARTRALSPAGVARGAEFVLYWMRTAMRGAENPALDVAITVANRLGVRVLVYQALSERYRYASDRHHTFILQGARDVAAQLAERGVAYAFHCERDGHRGPHLAALGRRAAVVITEEMPVAPLRQWTRRLADGLAERGAEDAPAVPVWAVDTACVVPMRVVGKGVTRAYAYRERIAPHLDAALAPWEDVAPAAGGAAAPALPALPFEPVDWRDVRIAELVAACDIDHTVGPVPETVGGSSAGYARWEAFCQQKLAGYKRARNDPNRHGGSRMSAYLHYGMVAPTRLAREARARSGEGADKYDGADKYIDELVVWRELAYTWCLYAREHEDLSALPDWARQSLLDHADDDRPARFDRETLARGKTGNSLWDAAQTSLRVHGELHNQVRMSWGKALLSWTDGPTEALAALIDLNHRYALDGRDPASYGGLLWCLGQFDRQFTPERPILGTVRPRPLAEHAARMDVEAWSAHVSRPLVSRPPRVIVIGGGPAGALCARTLADHQIPVMVFDKGRRPGARLSTRGSGARQFDYGAQYFTARDRHLAWRFRAWREAGLIAPWVGPFVTIDAATGEAVSGGAAPADVGGDSSRYVAVPGMGALVEHLLTDVEVRFEHQVVAIERDGGELVVRLTDGSHERCDRVVVAVPAPQAVPLLALAPALQRQLDAVEVAPCWAVMASFDQADEVGAALAWGGARVRGASVGWIAREQTKPGRSGGERWVIHATPAWSRQHLEDDREAVAQALAGAACALVAPGASPVAARAHRWRYALVETAVGEPCLYADGVGVCGDGLLGGRVECALQSGAAMAGRILGSL